MVSCHSNLPPILFSFQRKYIIFHVKNIYYSRPKSILPIRSTETKLSSVGIYRQVLHKGGTSRLFFFISQVAQTTLLLITCRIVRSFLFAFSTESAANFGCRICQRYRDSPLFIFAPKAETLSSLFPM